VSAASVEEQIRRTLDVRIRPYLQSHGGDVIGFALSGDGVEVRLAGACASCELVPVTFASRIRAELLKIPGVRSVHCSRISLTDPVLDRIARFFEPSVPDLASPANGVTVSNERH
jgi:Fe-S cluster biogenesis protein NfuA